VPERRRFRVTTAGGSQPVARAGRPGPGKGWRATPPPPEFVAAKAPTIDTVALATCPLCGHDQYRQVAVGFDYELRTCRNPWRFVRCIRCDHVWLNPRPSIATLATIYPPHYYAYDYEGRIHPIALRGKAFLDRRKLRSILRWLPREPRTFLDVGCGSGRFLKVMAERGLARDAIFGLELAGDVVGKLAAEGYRVYRRRVEEADEIADASIDLAIMFHVIEHVDDPARVVAKVSQWLSPRGVFAIETPNLDSLDAGLFGGTYWGGYHIPRHWHLFTPETLGRLLRDHGLDVLGVRFQTGHSFWMYSLHHWLRYGRRPWPRVARWFDPFSSVPWLVFFTAFDKLRAGLGARTSSMLILAGRTGETEAAA